MEAEGSFPCSQDCFLPNSFQIIIHQSFYHLTLYSVRYWQCCKIYHKEIEEGEVTGECSKHGRRENYITYTTATATLPRDPNFRILVFSSPYPYAWQYYQEAGRDWASFQQYCYTITEDRAVTRSSAKQQLNTQQRNGVLCVVCEYSDITQQQNCMERCFLCGPCWSYIIRGSLYYKKVLRWQLEEYEDGMTWLPVCENASTEAEEHPLLDD
jgi:hypothetical protein